MRCVPSCCLSRSFSEPCVPLALSTSFPRSFLFFSRPTSRHVTLVPPTLALGGSSVVLAPHVDVVRATGWRGLEPPTFVPATETTARIRPTPWIPLPDPSNRSQFERDRPDGRTRMEGYPVLSCLVDAIRSELIPIHARTKIETDAPRVRDVYIHNRVHKENTPTVRRRKKKRRKKKKKKNQEKLLHRDIACVLELPRTKKLPK